MKPMQLYKYIEFERKDVIPGQIRRIPGYAGTSLREIAQYTDPKWFTHLDAERIKAELYEHPRVVYQFEVNGLIDFPISCIQGFDWHKDIDNSWNEAKVQEFFESIDIIIGKTNQTLNRSITDAEMRDFMSAVWSRKPGWISETGGTAGESIVTIPCTMIKVPQPEVIAALM